MIRTTYWQMFVLVSLGFMVSASTLCAQVGQITTKEASTVTIATTVLNEIMTVPASSIPQALLADASGIAIIPNVLKGGFVVGVRHGKGVVCVRDPQAGWQPPKFVTLTGGSVGFQIGVNSTDVILVFKTAKSVEGLLNGKFTIGGDAAVAAGPVGRQAAAATDSRLKAEIYSYARSRGLFAGVSLDGSVLEIDQAAYQRYYYGSDIAARYGDPNRQPAMPPSAMGLIERLSAYSPGAGPLPGKSVVVTPAQPGAPAVASGQPDLLKNSLASASRKLQLVLDQNWRQYLALPAEVYTTGNPPNVKQLEGTLQRFEKIEKDPQYRTLTSRSEFVSTRDLLRQYVKSLSGTITLPPPPAAETSNASPGWRRGTKR